jgi:hypothetical protein
MSERQQLCCYDPPHRLHFAQAFAFLSLTEARKSAPVMFDDTEIRSHEEVETSLVIAAGYGLERQIKHRLPLY